MSGPADRLVNYAAQQHSASKIRQGIFLQRCCSIRAYKALSGRAVNAVAITREPHFFSAVQVPATHLIFGYYTPLILLAVCAMVTACSAELPSKTMKGLASSSDSKATRPPCCSSIAFTSALIPALPPLGLAGSRATMKRC